MLLPDAIEGHGYFWLPLDPNTKSPGILRISRSGSVELDLTRLSSHRSLLSKRLVLGDPLQYSGRRYHKRIVGVVKLGTFSKLITLENCCYKSWNFPSGIGVYSSTIVANIALVGVGCENEDELRFTEFRVSFAGLDEWLQITGVNIESEISEDGQFLGTTIKYAPPLVKEFQLNNGTTLEFNFDSRVPFLGSYTEATVDLYTLHIRTAPM